MDDNELLDIYGIDLSIKYIDINDKELELFSTKYISAYGELTNNGLKTLFKNIETENKIFYDLGSGNGTLIIRSILLYNLKKAIGIELSKKRFEYALNLYNKIKNPELKNKINFYNDDLFLIDISDADIIYISNLCFSNRNNRELGLKIKNSIKKKCIIFCSKEIPFISGENKSIINLSQSWNNNCYVYKYII